MGMQTIRVAFDEELLEQLDQRPEVRERGRSAVLREITARYLAEKRSEDIAREYREGYTKYPQTDEEIEWGSIQAWGDDGNVAGLEFLSRRVFLDTNIVQNLESFGEYCYDAYLSPEVERKITQRGDRFSDDIHALATWMALSRRAGWPIALSRRTFEELQANPNSGRRSRLIRWAQELHEYSSQSGQRTILGPLPRLVRSRSCPTTAMRS